MCTKRDQKIRNNEKHEQTFIVSSPVCIRYYLI